MEPERRPLLSPRRSTATPLSLFFATLCIVDQFGVFPVIALPRVIINCGWMGIPLAFFVFGLEIYTAILLGRCWIIAEKLDPSIFSKSRYPYAALAEMTFGVNVSRAVTVLLDVTIFGASVPNLMVASQNLQLVGLKMTQYSFDLSFCIWMVILGVLLCPIMWLGSPRDMKWLTTASVLTVLSVSLLTWVCLALDTSFVRSAVLPGPSWESVVMAYGILVFQFDIHPMILSVQVDMENKNKLGHAIVGGFTVTCGLFLTTTLFVLLKYGETIRSNVLQGLPGSIPLYLDVLLVTLQICLSMVVGASALFQDLEDKLNVPKEFNWRRCVTRSFLLMSAVAIGETVPRFDLIMGLIGGTLTGPLMFVLPPLIYVRLRTLQTKYKLQASMDCIRQPLSDDKCFIDDIDSFVDLLQSEEPFLQQYQTTEHPYRQQLLVAKEEKEDMAVRALFDDNYRQIDRFENADYSRSFVVRLIRAIYRFLSMEDSVWEGPMTSLESISIGSIVALGVVATATATYFSVRDTVRYAQFTPSCIW